VLSWGVGIFGALEGAVDRVGRKIVEISNRPLPDGGASRSKHGTTSGLGAPSCAPRGRIPRQGALRERDAERFRMLHEEQARRS